MSPGTPVHVDTNYLILLCAGEEAIGERVVSWLEQGESIAVSAIAWAEFLVRPIPPRAMEQLREVLTGGIIPFDRATAESAGIAFRSLKLKRRDRVDSFIAAAAMMAGARLATQNQRDFRRFVPLGLKLA